MSTIRRFSRQARPTNDLTPEVIAILLSGWGARPPAGETTPEAESDGVLALAGGWGAAAPRDREEENRSKLFDLFQRRESGCVHLWQRHEAFLLAEAQRLGIEPPIELPDGRRVFYGQFVQLSQQTRSEYWLAVNHDDSLESAG